jgi:hypothetical protein
MAPAMIKAMAPPKIPFAPKWRPAVGLLERGLCGRIVSPVCPMGLSVIERVRLIRLSLGGTALPTELVGLPAWA